MTRSLEARSMLVAALALLLAAPAGAGAQEPGSDAPPPTSGSSIGDAFYGPGHVADVRADLSGRSLMEAAVDRARRARRGERFRETFLPPGAGLGKPEAEEPEPTPGPPGARLPAPRFLHPAGGRFIVVREAPARERTEARARRRTPRRSPRAVRRSGVARAPVTEEADPAVGRAPTEAAGRIGRHLRDAGKREAARPGAACARVHLETASGIGFDVRVDPEELRAGSPEEVGRILRLRIDEKEVVVLPLLDGEEMEFAPGGIAAVVSGPCR